MADKDVFGSLEWTVMMGAAVVSLGPHPGTTLTIRANEREGEVKSHLVNTLGTKGDVTTAQLKKALPEFSVIKWKDQPVGMGLGSVELSGEAPGMRITLMKSISRSAKPTDPEVVETFRELLEIKDTTLADILRGQ